SALPPPLLQKQETLEQGRGKGRIQAITWLPGSTTLVAIHETREVSVWDTSSNRFLRRYKVAHGGSFSPDSRFLAEGMLNAVRFCDVETGQPRGTILVLRNDIHFAIS